MLNKRDIKKYIESFAMSLKKKDVVPVIDIKREKDILKDKVVLIAGGTGGIGFAIAQACLQSGGNVIIAGTNPKKIKKINELYGSDKLKTMVFDYSKVSSFDVYLHNAINLFKRIDIFISCVGVHSEGIDFFNMSSSEYDRVMNINLKGTYFACQKISKYMIDSNIQGHILLISSSRGSEPAWSPYGLSKWGMNGMIKGLAKELISKDIVVNGISPGSTATELLGIKKGDSIYANDNHIERMTMPQEVGNLAVMLVSEAGNMIVGENIHISGGRGVWDIR